MRSISILIPVRFVFDAIILTIESIVRRTRYPNYNIIVCDNSLAVNNRACEPHHIVTLSGDDGNRRDYLKDQAEKGNIRLIEIKEQAKRYGHGENLKILLDACKAELAMLFVSTAEITDGDWLSVLARLIKDDNDLGVARFRGAGVDSYGMYRTPVYWPNIMMLDMRKYREFSQPSDWDLEQMCYRDFPRKEIFADFPRYDDNLVFCDTGWRLWERLTYDNQKGYRMLPLPNGYYMDRMKLFGGIDRNSHRPHHPHVQGRLAIIKERLDILKSI